jgi:hypothetical protein
MVGTRAAHERRVAYRDHSLALEASIRALRQQRRALDSEIAAKTAELRATRRDRVSVVVNLVAWSCALVMAWLGFIAISSHCIYPSIAFLFEQATRADARAVARAAELYLANHAGRCPSVQDLVDERLL